MTKFDRGCSFCVFDLDYDLFEEVVRVALIAVPVFWCHGGVDPTLCRGLIQLFADCLFLGSLGIFASFLFSSFGSGICSSFLFSRPSICSGLFIFKSFLFSRPSIFSRLFICKSFLFSRLGICSSLNIC